MLCRNKEVWPNTHSHSTVAESRRCWSNVQSAPRPASPPVSPPVSVRRVSENQLNLIERLNGDVIHAYKLTFNEADALIKRLLQEQEGKKKEKKVDPKLTMVTGMLKGIPDGNYAAQAEEGDRIDFLRITRPDKGKFKGALKVQSRHSDTLRTDAVLWPSGIWSVYYSYVVDALLMVVADRRGCMRLFAKELGQCCICGKSLTDERSRHYGIGPECEKDHPEIIEEVDNEDEEARSA